MVTLRVASTSGVSKTVIKNIELTDEMMFIVASSPINIVLRGVNTVYGSNSQISIDGSETYDSDIEGMHYYLPFMFNWECPQEIPVYDCKNKALSGSNPYFMKLYSKSLVNNGLSYNEYYKFSALAKRRNKKTLKDFWIKIIDLPDIPHVGKFLVEVRY